MSIIYQFVHLWQKVCIKIYCGIISFDNLLLVVHIVKLPQHVMKQVFFFWEIFVSLDTALGIIHSPSLKKKKKNEEEDLMVLNCNYLGVV